MITQQQAITAAKIEIGTLDYVDSGKVLGALLVSRDMAIEAGAPDNPELRSRWLVDFARVKTGHALDDVFDSLLVSVDAETGKTQIIPSM